MEDNDGGDRLQAFSFISQWQNRWPTTNAKTQEWKAAVNVNRVNVKSQAYEHLQYLLYKRHTCAE